jgi:hypothetical protein
MPLRYINSCNNYDSASFFFDIYVLYIDWIYTDLLDLLYNNFFNFSNNFTLWSFERKILGMDIIRAFICIVHSYWSNIFILYNKTKCKAIFQQDMNKVLAYITELSDIYTVKYSMLGF